MKRYQKKIHQNSKKNRDVILKIIHIGRKNYLR